MSPPPRVVRLLVLTCLLGLLAVAEAADSIWFPAAGVRPHHTHVRPDDTRTRIAQTPGADLTPSPSASVPLQIPLELLRKLGEVQNAADFINNFVDSDSLAHAAADISGHELENRFGGGDERKSVQIAKAALCQPQLELVSLTITTDPSSYYYPTCIRIERCGGCCGGDLLSCQPIETEIVNVKVLLTQYTGKAQMSFKGHEIVPVERHTKCKCDCTKKETDCNPLQEYRKNECVCACKNVDEQQKCFAQNQLKKWDDNTCTCKCRDPRDCNGGSYFDQDTCSCTQNSALRNRRREIYYYEPAS